MKGSVWVVVLIALLSQAKAMGSKDATGNELVCPDANPLNCYPKLFEATEEWQEVKEGQTIPVGLEVRLDLENMKREARLDPERELLEKDKDQQFQAQAPMQKNHELVVANTDSSFQNSLDFMDRFSQNMYSKTSFTIVLDHLETLVEWSSDRESGIAIANDIKPLLRLSGIYTNLHGRGGVKGGRVDKGVHVDLGLDTSQALQVQDMVLRILASSLRNNVEAQQVLLQQLTDPEDFMVRLIAGDEMDTPLIAKRKLGILGAIINNNVFAKYYADGGIESKLVILYGETKDRGVQERILNLLDDIRLVKRDETDESVDNNENHPEGLDERYTRVAQRVLLNSDASDTQSHALSMQILDHLASMKSQDSHAFKPQPDFLDWLDKLITAEKERQVLQRREDGSSTSASSLERLVELRHEVFGNRLGTRRDFDEL